MTVELGVIIALVGLAISFAAFFIGRTSASKKEGVAAGSQSTGFAKDIEYIKQALERIEGSFSSEVDKLNGRVNELSVQVGGLATVAEKARASAKSAHLRMNTHERMEHNKPVSDWRGNIEE